MQPVEKARGLLEEFRKFALKGNVIDMAIGVIIGAAFAKIVDSLVKHIIMPLVSTIMPGDQSYLKWSFILRGKEIPYGLFIGEVVNFLIVAFALFIFVVKFLGWIMKMRKEDAPPAAAPPAPTREELLLTDIRDILKNRS